MSYRMSTLIAVGLLTASALLVSSCGFQTACTDIAKSSLSLNFADESGNKVVPDEIVVTHEETGDEATPDPLCSGGPGGFTETAGTFTVRAECGSETVTRQVEVTDGQCHVNSKQVTLTFPDGACRSCPVDGSMRDTGGGGDAGTTADAS